MRHAQRLIGVFFLLYPQSAAISYTAARWAFRVWPLGASCSTCGLAQLQNPALACRQVNKRHRHRHRHKQTRPRKQHEQGSASRHERTHARTHARKHEHKEVCLDTAQPPAHPLQPSASAKRSGTRYCLAACLHASFPPAYQLPPSRLAAFASLPPYPHPARGMVRLGRLPGVSATSLLSACAGSKPRRMCWEEAH